jgi:hypothetical protein
MLTDRDHRHKGDCYRQGSEEQAGEFAQGKPGVAPVVWTVFERR